MVSTQANCTSEAALALMRDTAAAADTTLEQVAQEVVAGRVRFDPPASD